MDLWPFEKLINLQGQVIRKWYDIGLRDLQSVTQIFP